MRKQKWIRKGLAVLLTATMVAGLVPDVGTVKVFATEADGGAATEQGYDADGFCTGFKFDEGGNWVKDEGSSTPCTHGETCNGYQPAVEEQLDYDINGDDKVDADDKAYKIGNAGQLYWFADKVNNDYENYGSANAVLTDNITVNSGLECKNGLLDSLVYDEETEAVTNGASFRSWTPIGAYATPYSGIFDGQGKTVSGFFSNTEKSYVGLFGANNGTIKNVGVADSYFKGVQSTGGVCGGNKEKGIIDNCHNDGKVIGIGDNLSIAGGVCGKNNNKITNCYNTGIVTGSGNDVGGVCGHTLAGTPIIENCYNTGIVTGSGNHVGGVCGYAYAKGTTISNCYNTGEVIASGQYAGGVCGELYINGSIKNCYNTGNVTGANNVGGVAGFIRDASVSNCYSSGMVKGTAESPKVGGIGGELV